MADRSWRNLVGIGLTVTLMACGVTQWEPQILPEGGQVPPPGGAPYLKAHLHSGEVVVLSDWRGPTEGASSLDGYGVRYSVDRTAGVPGVHALPMDSIALLEANRKETVSRFAFSGLTVYTVSSTLVAASCVADPKSCFGSCPTFYVEGGASEQLVAEGFSSSVARVFEANDVDALPTQVGNGTGFSLLMRNEAPETHAIRSLHLLAAPTDSRGAVYATSLGGFREGSAVHEPVGCRVLGSTPEIDCSAAVRILDDVEFFSLADSLDLATREWIEVEMPSLPSGREAGILIRGRASLLSTFLFYQTLAYVGEEAGSYLASLERGDPDLARKAMGLPAALGPVEVFVQQEGGWEKAGSFGEAGPIAADEQVVVLPTTVQGPVRIRLRMAKGAWRIDRIGLVGLGEPVEPVVLSPIAVDVVSGEVPTDVALNRLLDPERYLVTQQGDEYRVHFQLPEGAEKWSLFLDSRGYYYEWMRGEWLGETNPAMAAMILSDPEGALRRMAPAFKAREAGMEDTFWSSRFRRNHR